MDKSKIRSFGRVKSRKLSDTQNEKLENILPKYLLNELPKTYEKLYFEIGFGYGEHTCHQAILNKDATIIACETYINGVLSLVEKIESNNIENIKIFNGDARLLLEKVQDNSIDIVFILFPDPWPKNKQNKRRIISEEFLDLLRQKLKKNGSLFFASDILHYIEWTINMAKNRLHPVFNRIEDCKKEPEWWVRTRYQEKAIREGRDSYFLEFRNKPF